MIKKIAKILKGNSINSPLKTLNVCIMTIYIVIDTIKIIAFIKLFKKAPISLFFLAK